VYYNPTTLEHKKLPSIDPGMVKQKFDNPHLIVFTDPALLHDHLLNSFWDNVNLLMMSSGNFSGIDVSELATSITEDDDFPSCYMDF